MNQEEEKIKEKDIELKEPEKKKVHFGEPEEEKEQKEQKEEQEDEEEQEEKMTEEDMLIKDEHSIWQKNSPFLYDFIVVCNINN